MNDKISEKIKAVEDEIKSVTLRSQREDIEKEIMSLKKIKNKKGRAAAIFRLKERIVGNKKQSQEAMSIIDPSNG